MDNFNTHKWFKNQYLKEAHEDDPQGQIEYIKSALKNLSSEDLKKVYDQVEKYDPKYPNKKDNE